MAEVITDRAHRTEPVWGRRVRLRVFVADAVAVYVGVFTAFLVRFGDGDLNIAALGQHGIAHNYGLISIGLLLLWLVALMVGSNYQLSRMGCGTLEYSRLILTSVFVFGLVAITAYLAEWRLARSFVAVALPVGTVLLLIGRWICRKVLVRERRRGMSMYRALMVGTDEKLAVLSKVLGEMPAAGFMVVATCSPDVAASGQVADALAGMQIDSVIVTGSDHLNALALKRFSWDIEPLGANMIIAPGMLDVSAARVRTHPLQGTPLMTVDPPGYRRWQLRVKGVCDFIGALFMLIGFSLPMLVVAVLVKVTSPGPVLFRQPRLGENGRVFNVLKFRSMRTDQDEKAWDAARLRGEVEEAQGAFSKPKNDPRITPIGRVLRRYSIDELPQLLNVLAGQMSIVGPRPLLSVDHEQYGRDADRRLLLKPGITGLWQVSGRNHLSVEESARLDYYYVENWSLLEDFSILARTVKAVLGRDGAY